MIIEPMHQMFGSKKGNNMFQCHKSDGNGFRIGFKNGYQISVRFGGQNYCENSGLDKKFMASKDAEIAIINPRGELVKLSENDTVLANQSAEDLVELMYKYVRMKNASN